MLARISKTDTSTTGLIQATPQRPSADDSKELEGMDKTNGDGVLGVGDSCCGGRLNNRIGDSKAPKLMPSHVVWSGVAYPLKLRVCPAYVVKEEWVWSEYRLLWRVRSIWDEIERGRSDERCEVLVSWSLDDPTTLYLLPYSAAPSRSFTLSLSRCQEFSDILERRGLSSEAGKESRRLWRSRLIDDRRGKGQRLVVLAPPPGKGADVSLGRPSASVLSVDR